MCEKKMSPLLCVSDEALVYILQKPNVLKPLKRAGLQRVDQPAVVG